MANPINALDHLNYTLYSENVRRFSHTSIKVLHSNKSNRKVNGKD